MTPPQSNHADRMPLEEVVSQMQLNESKQARCKRNTRSCSRRRHAHASMRVKRARLPPRSSPRPARSLHHQPGHPRRLPRRPRRTDFHKPARFGIALPPGTCTAPTPRCWLSAWKAARPTYRPPPLPPHSWISPPMSFSTWADAAAQRAQRALHRVGTASCRQVRHTDKPSGRGTRVR